MGMLVGVCTVELFLPESNSLKGKRMVISSIKKRVRNKFNVSISEIGHFDKWQRIIFGISLVTNEQRLIDSTIGEILKLISSDVRVEVLGHLTEVY